MISTATPSRPASSAAMSSAIPLPSPVAGSLAVSNGFPKLIAARSLPVGASSATTAGERSGILSSMVGGRSLELRIVALAQSLNKIEAKDIVIPGRVAGPARPFFQALRTKARDHEL